MHSISAWPALLANRRIDAGANFRLSKASPNLNFHAGATARF
jgi:hypothetical protein